MAVKPLFPQKPLTPAIALVFCEPPVACGPCCIVRRRLAICPPDFPPEPAIRRHSPGNSVRLLFHHELFQWAHPVSAGREGVARCRDWSDARPALQPWPELKRGSCCLQAAPSSDAGCSGCTRHGHIGTNHDDPLGILAGFIRYRGGLRRRGLRSDRQVSLCFGPAGRCRT